MSPVFRHGGLRLYLLGLLEESPRHGYEVIVELENRFLGTYAPSAGTVYPRLAKLETEGLVRHDSVEGRKVFSLTDDGRAELDAHRDALADVEREVREGVARAAEQVRRDVGASARDLRAELTAAARDARREQRASERVARSRAERDDEKALARDLAGVLKRAVKKGHRADAPTIARAREVVARFGAELDSVFDR